MNSYQKQYDFTVADAVKKWQILTENYGILLEQEFNALRKMDESRITIATDPINKSKNRFPSVYPYDEDFCRVSLKKNAGHESKDNSDYINASLIRSTLPEQLSSTSSSRVFYAAQGPNEHTLDDFIRMIVEQEISVIVMLSFSYDPITCTYAQEHTPYVSERVNATIETKNYQIRTTAIVPAYRYIGRRLRIKSKLTDSVFNCEQYHYPHFMDKSIPADCHSLIGLVMRLREASNRDRRILVHCNAGVGRTGVFIALYYLIETFEHHGKLNVKQLVDTIRYYRPHLVQTAEQYEYLYRCLAEVAIHPCDGRSLDDFIGYFNRQLPTANSNSSTIYYDFMNRTNRIQSNSFLTTIIAKEHAQFNRNENFIPYDFNRVILHSPSESTYINATKVSNVTGPMGTIITQEPMKCTLQPFFSMLLQEYKTFIVAVEHMQKPNYAELQYISPSGIKADILPVNKSKNKIGDYFQSYKIKLQNENIREAEVFIYEYTGEWTNDGTNLPHNLEQFVRFVDRSIHHQRNMDRTRLGLVVHDRDGGPKAAFYCIVQNLFDRLLIDGRVAIENFITDICQQRVNALHCLEQYIALHHIVGIWNHLKRRGALECTAN